LAIGNVFWWLIPFVGGWFGISTIIGRKEETNELLSNRKVPQSRRGDERRNAQRPAVFVVGEESDEENKHKWYERSQLLSWNTRPDKTRLSPFYIFARFHEWTKLATIVSDAYGTALQEDDPLQKSPNILALVNKGLDSAPPSDYCHIRLKALCCAFLLYSATCWSSFMIAYMTVTVGLGCRSFGFLIYYAVSLVVFVCLFLASFFEQRHSESKRLLYGWIEVGLRKFGKVLAFLNALILFGNCLLQFTGVYYSCYCQSNRIGMGLNAYMAYPNDDVSAQISERFWWGGFGMAVGTSVACLLVVWLLRWRRHG
jgi:hypothetical protein